MNEYWRFAVRWSSWNIVHIYIYIAPQPTNYISFLKTNNIENEWFSNFPIFSFRSRRITHIHTTITVNSSVCVCLYVQIRILESAYILENLFLPTHRSINWSMWSPSSFSGPTTNRSAFNEQEQHAIRAKWQTSPFAFSQTTYTIHIYMCISIYKLPILSYRFISLYYFLDWSKRYNEGSAC